MNIIQEKIHDLPFEKIIEITKNYEQLERDASIGDCLLREIAEEFERLSRGSSTILWMEKVAFEAYRHIANTFLTEAGLK